jgi:hypothetical protein
MKECPFNVAFKKYGRQMKYLLDPAYVDFEIRQSLASELKEDPKTIEEMILRVTAKHYLDKSKRENDWDLVGMCIGTIWGSVYGHDNIGRVTSVCVPDYIPSLIEMVTSTQSMKKSKGFCGGRYYVNPEELLFLCTHFKEETNELGFNPFERLDVFYEGPENIGTRPSSLCNNMLEIVDKDTTRILSLDEIFDLLSKKLNIGIADYEKKAEVVRGKLFH